MVLLRHAPENPYRACGNVRVEVEVLLVGVAEGLHGKSRAVDLMPSPLGQTLPMMAGCVALSSSWLARLVLVACFRFGARSQSSDPRGWFSCVDDSVGVCGETMTRVASP